MKKCAFIELEGHILDSLTLSKVYDTILDNGGTYTSKDIKIGKTKKDFTYVCIKVMAGKEEALNSILEKLYALGAVLQKNVRA